MTEHIKTRHKVKGISTPSGFEEILSSVILSDVDKEILRMHYLKELSFMDIAGNLGFSESGVKKRHKKALRKIAKVI